MAVVLPEVYCVTKDKTYKAESSQDNYICKEIKLVKPQIIFQQLSRQTRSNIEIRQIL